MKYCVVICFLWWASGVLAIPVSQPVYANTQYISAQLPANYPAQQPYLQQISAQPQYITTNAAQEATPIYNDAQRSQAPQQFVPPPQPPTQRVTQLLLPTNVDRQIQKVAQQSAGPYYAQQISAIQQQAQANQAIAAAQRRAQYQARLIQQQQQQQQEQLQQQQQLQHQQPQQSQVEYYTQPQVAQSTRPVVRTIQQGYKNVAAAPQPQPQAEEDAEDYDNNASYQFGFDVKDDQYTNYQNRKEQREGGKITGSYSVVDSDGFIRTVTYTADPKEGFKAEVVRQPTDIVVKIPTPAPVTRQQQQQYIQEVPAPKIQQGQKQNIVYRYQ